MGEMPTDSDAQLLRAYADHGADDAFTALVQRHTNLVYSAALRQVESPDAAADIAQRVFIGLARGASALAPRLTADASLAGWLCRSARNLSLNHRRDEFRRHTRERQAMAQLTTISDDAPDWEQLRRVLDDALAELGETDYDALVLRYFQQQDFRTVGAALGVSDDTAQKRVARALETLREHLSRRGIHATATALSAVIAANAVQAAPVGLAVTISAAALAGTAATTSTLIAATTKTIAMTTLQKTLVTATVAVLAGAGIYEARQAAQLRDQVQTLQQQQAPLAEQVRQLQNNFTDATNRLADLFVENSRLKSNPNQSELLKLRGEVTRLQNEVNNPTENTARAIAAKIKWLRQRLEQMPDKKIPELQFTTEKDWADAIWNADLNTDDGVREALSRLRETAINIFLNEMMQSAFKNYLAANNDILPADLSQLKPFFNVPVSDEMLQRYQLLQTGKPDKSADLVKLVAYADEDYDSNHNMAINGAGGGRFNKIQEAVQAAVNYFTADNNGQMPSQPFQIMSYLKKPIDVDTVQKYLNQIIAKTSK
jgi:RNA polymerase sigma factor (sigma-70 family)